jgi:hypothetical protein
MFRQNDQRASIEFYPALLGVGWNGLWFRPGANEECLGTWKMHEAQYCLLSPLTELSISVLSIVEDDLHEAP